MESDIAELLTLTASPAQQQRLQTGVAVANGSIRRAEVEEELRRLSSDPFLEDIDSDSDAEDAERLRRASHIARRRAERARNASPPQPASAVVARDAAGPLGPPSQPSQPPTDADSDLTPVGPAAAAAAVSVGASSGGEFSSAEDEEQDDTARGAATDAPASAAPAGGGFRDWLSRAVASVKQIRWVPSTPTQLFMAEQRVLEAINGLFQQRTVSTPLCDINTISFPCRNPELRRRHFVLLHGFGFGLAQWVPTWVSFATLGNVHAIDLPGFARSGRPDFNGTAQDAILFFIQTLEEWLKRAILEPHAAVAAAGEEPETVLVGHSFGGYIAGKFAAQYPHRVSTVLLVDAFGIKNRPQEMVEQFYRDASAAKKLKIWGAKKLFYSVNPLCLLRGAGPLGPSLMAKKKRRMALSWKEYVGGDGSAILDYLYHANSQNPSGERVFSLLVEGLGAGIGEGWIVKAPLEAELVALPAHIRLVFITGSRSWIPSSGALEVTQERNAKSPGSSNTEAFVVHAAGHHVYSDQPALFGQIVEKLFAPLPSKGAS